MYTEPLTNITFPTWSDGEGYTFGMIVPDTALTTNEYDYIGYLVRWLHCTILRLSNLTISRAAQRPPEPGKHGVVYLMDSPDK